MSLKISAIFAVLVALAAGAVGYEIKVNKLGSWELGFSARPPRTIELATEQGKENYTYVVYEIKNDTQEEINFIPSLQLQADGGDAVTGDSYGAAAKEIRRIVGGNLLDQAGITGCIKPGETRRGVAIWKNFEPGARQLTLYVQGLSDDFKMVKNENGHMLTMYRTYKLTYRRTGSAEHVAINPVQLVTCEWIWRE